MLLAKLPTPLLPTLRGEDCARLAAAKKRIPGKELVNDGLGLRIIPSEAKRRDFLQISQPHVYRGNHRLALLDIDVRPRQVDPCRVALTWLPRCPGRILNRAADLFGRDNPPATRGYGLQHLGNLVCAPIRMQGTG